MKILDYLNQFNLDIRRTGDARFMDQKVTPDVLCIIADCVINFLKNDTSREFTVKDIWNSKYFNTIVKDIFSKPDVTEETAKHEYDKLIQQPLKALSYAHILNCEKRGNTNYFSVKNYELFEFISLKDRNAYNFLYQYLVKVLTDSGLIKFFKEFKKKYEAGEVNNNHFKDLKDRFEKFIIGNTNITGRTEVRRIFPKVLNIYASKNNIPGTISGRISKYPFYYTDLMYNRRNWRDVHKDKILTRQEADNLYDKLISEKNTPYNKYLVVKAKNIIRKLHRYSEVKDRFAGGEATQVHHIFAQNDFPQIAHYVENLIKLTATQHFTKAHPSNDTHMIDKDYQLVCLLAKSDSVKKSIKAGQMIYRKESFIHVINIGLTLDLPSLLSYKDIKLILMKQYNDN
ncbi:hypothetical protein MYX06_04630 [Patescibacteria group bacterium AH-259-L05]|nr:hypothetical protein [Patescibacteria group bacterium AH-259-L05]